MRHLLFTVGTLLIISCSTSKEPNDDIRKQPKPIVPAPGVLWLKDNLFIDETEITNLHYMEYEYMTGRLKPAESKKVLLDTLTWTTDSFGNKDLAKYYLRHPVYRDYPVVGISYPQAVDYCRWRTDMVNAMLYFTKKGTKKWNYDSTFNYPKEVLYRLPTREEWAYAAHAGLDSISYPLGYVNLTSKEGKPINYTLEYYNLFLRPHITLKSPKRPGPTHNVKTGAFANKFGLLNMNGNVSELVADSLVMGLNFKTLLDGKPLYPENYQLESYLKYERPQIWIGFRCVCEVLKIK